MDEQNVSRESLVLGSKEFLVVGSGRFSFSLSESLSIVLLKEPRFRRFLFNFVLFPLGLLFRFGQTKARRSLGICQ
jgi:hypothetical protein